MPATFAVQVLTPERAVLAGEIVSLQAPGSEGFLGVLAHHAPLITALRPGPVRLRYASGAEEVLAVSGGFLEVAGNRAVILADAAERSAEIDRARAQAAQDRARRRLAERTAGIDVARADAALARAVNRLRVSARWGGTT